jgi:hypothetical protein
MVPEDFDPDSRPDKTERESKHKGYQLARDLILIIQNASELRGKLMHDDIIEALDTARDELVNSRDALSGADLWQTFLREHAPICASKQCPLGDEFHVPTMDSPDCQACFELWELTR